MNNLEYFGIFILCLFIYYIFMYKDFILEYVFDKEKMNEEPFIDDIDYTYNNKSIIEKLDGEHICTCLSCGELIKRINITEYSTDDSAICPLCLADLVVHYELSEAQIKNIKNQCMR